MDHHPRIFLPRAERIGTPLTQSGGLVLHGMSPDSVIRDAISSFNHFGDDPILQPCSIVSSVTGRYHAGSIECSSVAPLTEENGFVILDRLHPSNGALTDETLCSLEMYLMSDDIADEQPADFSGSILLCNHHVGPHGPVGWVCSRQRTAPRNILVADRGSDVIVMIGRTVDRAFAQVYDVVDLERAAPPRHSLDWGTFPDEGARVQPLRE